MEYLSWGRFPQNPPAVVFRPHWADTLLPDTDLSLLPYGNGRSYGDSCQNGEQALIDMQKLNRILHFDRASGILRCEAGVLLADILSLIVPMGWFPPVTPGTQFITIGGAIANDVHGKNHHRRGTFGQHVRRFALKRSDVGTILCSPIENTPFFEATIGGLGLTGVILWAEIQLRRIANPAINAETLPFHHLDAFFDLSEESDQDYEYTVAWVDCLARGKALGRGIFTRGNHAPPREKFLLPSRESRSFPVNPPFSLVNRMSVKAFNAVHYHRHRRPIRRSCTHYSHFFYPLDGILHWNRLYGSKGFLQYQCVIPISTSRDATRALLEAVSYNCHGSFLAVLKMFGNLPSPGWLSFPREGTTLALDFPNRGINVLRLLDQLDQIVAAAGGAVYPAKDARMSSEHFKQYFPRWEKFQSIIDPHFSSSFWRRVVDTVPCATS